MYKNPDRSRTCSPSKLLEALRDPQRAFPGKREKYQPQTVVFVSARVGGGVSIQSISSRPSRGSPADGCMKTAWVWGGWRLESSTTTNETVWQKPEPPRSPVTIAWVVHQRRGRTQIVAFFPTCTLAESRTSPAWALKAAATTICLGARSDFEALPPPSQISREVTSCHHHLPILQ